MIRTILFLITNISVVLVFGLVLLFTGVKSNTVQALLISSLVFGFLGSFVSLYFSKWIALYSVNGKIIKEAKTYKEAWLIRIVQNQSKIVGITVPEVSIYESSNLNAFATGFSKNSSLIAVSSSLLNSMNESEVEAVIAHEISHISNGDMVTMTLLQGCLNTFIIFFSRFFAQSLSGNLVSSKYGERTQNRLTSVLYFTTSMTLELIFGLMATAITMWFSRKREYYADAGAAKIVGIDNMVAALKKLALNHQPLRKSSISAFCISGKSSIHLTNLFVSHPTIKKRIEALYNREYL